MKCMKIGFFTDGYLPQKNGVATSVDLFAKELERLGHEVYIVAPKYPGVIDGKNVIRLTSVKVSTKPELRVALHLPDKSLRKVVSINFDIIHGHSGGPITLLGWEIARTKNIPYVATYHTLWSKYTHYFLRGKVIKPKMLEGATRIFTNQCTHIIAPSNKIRKELLRYGVKKPISIIPSGVNISVFQGDKEDVLRQKTGASSEDKILLYVGRLGKEKSVDFLIRSFRLILEENKKTSLVLVGDGPERHALFRLAKELGIEKNTHFFGEVDPQEMPEIYRSADCFVFASTSETQGMVLLEALASSLPVVAVKDLSTSDVIKNGVNGFLVKKRQGAFAGKVAQVLKDDLLRAKLSENARGSVLEHDIAKTTQKLDALYKKLVNDFLKDSVFRLMRFQSFRERLFVVDLFFWLTALTTRMYVWGSYQRTDLYPRLSFGMFSFSPLSLGLILIGFSIALSIRRKADSVLPFALLGIGLGWVLDEAWSFLTGGLGLYSSYWGVGNLITILIFGTAPVILAEVVFKKAPKFKFVMRGKHINPSHPRISIVVPAYNEERFLGNTLQSIINQSVDEFELIVVDNNSTDKTSEVALSYGARVIKEKHPGVALARQAGFLAAKGEIIATTDADTVVPHDWLERILSEMENNKYVAFGGLNRLYSGPVSARAAGRFLFSPFWIIDRYLSGGWNLMGSNLAVRKSAFEKIGGFNTKLTLGEDVDLAKRLREVGEIKIDTDFLVFSSGRRFRNGLLLGVVTYMPSYIARVVLKKDKFLSFPTIRTEKSVLGKLTFIPLAVSTALLFLAFYFANR